MKGRAEIEETICECQRQRGKSVNLLPPWVQGFTFGLVDSCPVQELPNFDADV
jgi:hypothetical protein